MADKCTYFRKGNVSERLFPTLNVGREHNEVTKSGSEVPAFRPIHKSVDRWGAGRDSSFKTHGSIIRNCA